jgi:polysaccharide deacetylase family protein (PEP-CTERM system associated)
VVNALTFDIEDYFMVSAFSDRNPVEKWEHQESRVARNTDRILDILDTHGVKATFFVLGWVAERFPGIVRNIHEEGHEIGCHSYAHRLVYQMTRESFREDTRKAKILLEDASGAEVIGYRAPSYSITGDSMWAIDLLIELGFRYDSSIFPVRHDRYGIPGFARSAGIIERDGKEGIFEVPLSTVRFLGVNVPFGGGGYLRLYPALLTEWGIRHLNTKEGRPSVVYIHPWEIDPGQPRLRGTPISVFRHYVNIASTEKKLIRLLDRFRFAPVREVFRLSLGGKSFVH